MKKANDGTLVAALLIIIVLIVISICGCNTVNGIGRDLCRVTDPYVGQQQTKQPGNN